MKKMIKKGILGAIGLGTLKAKIIVIGGSILIILSGIFIIGLFQALIGGDDEGNSKGGGVFIDLPSGTHEINALVESYRGIVEIEAKKNGIEGHVDVLLALLMQESGGFGSDPFQASESKCGFIGCITNPKDSIAQGVYYYSTVLASANNDIKLALQSYNFGGGFIGYVKQNGGAYTQDLAISFSQKMYQKLKHQGIYRCVRPDMIPLSACYGDVYYVDAVLKYYHPVSSEQIEGIAVGGTGEWKNPINDGAIVTSPFGMRKHPISGKSEGHKGMDFACVGGITPIKAVDSGSITYASWMNGYGNTVIIKHSEKLYSHYGHMSSLGVKIGDSVQVGQSLGICGSTGDSTGPHLHLEAKTEQMKGHYDPATMFK